MAPLALLLLCQVALYTTVTSKKARTCPLPRHLKVLPGSNQVPFETVLEYTCDEGFERGECLADGTATEPPVCRDISCPIPKGIPNGFLAFAVMRTHGYKETVRYACNDHYVLDGQAENRCTNTGNWSTKPVCRAPCSVNIKRGRISYNGRKLWIADLKPNRVLHGERVLFYCKNKVQKCGYPVASTCNDGTLTLPKCFEEPGKLEYTMRSKTLPSEINVCDANPSAAPSSAAPA
ncbi:unnamed protein product [Arctogadus glacialis]